MLIVVQIKMIKLSLNFTTGRRTVAYLKYFLPHKSKSKKTV